MGSKIYLPIFGENFSIDPKRSFTFLNREIYWYAVIIALGLILAAVYIYKRRKTFGLTEDNVIDMFIIAIPSAVIGGRLYYVIFNFSLFKEETLWGTIKAICSIWNGGMAIYGAIILSAICLMFYGRKKKIPLGTMYDVAGLGLLIGQAIGRWGNFINREAHGVETTLPWRMGLETGEGIVYVHPTFLYESLWNVIGFVLIHNYSKRRKYDGQIFAMYVAWYGFGRFFIELLRTDSLYLFGNVRVSCVVAAVSFVIAVAYLVIMRKKGLTADSLYVNRKAKAEEKRKIWYTPMVLDADESAVSQLMTEYTAPEGDEPEEESVSQGTGDSEVEYVVVDGDDLPEEEGVEYEYVYVDEDGNEIDPKSGNK